MNKLITTLMVGTLSTALPFLVGSASAASVLSDKQLDTVTAGQVLDVLIIPGLATPSIFSATVISGTGGNVSFGPVSFGSVFISAIQQTGTVNLSGFNFQN